jgi:hypothetical protein
MSTTTPQSTLAFERHGTGVPIVDAHQVRRDVVLGHWDQLMRTDADELQAWVEELAGSGFAAHLRAFVEFCDGASA